LPFFGWSLIKLAHDGLEREFKLFNWLEGGVCTMCAPRDQRKSGGSQDEQAELNAVAASQALWPRLQALAVKPAREGDYFERSAFQLVAFEAQYRVRSSRVNRFTGS
jgi:hypothetical protein